MTNTRRTTVTSVDMTERKFHNLITKMLRVYIGTVVSGGCTCRLKGRGRGSGWTHPLTWLRGVWNVTM